MNIKESFIFAWGLSYLICSVLSPNMVQNVGATATRAVFIVVGGSVLSGLALIKMERWRTVGSLLLLAVGVFEVFGMWSSWTGAMIWSVGLPNQTVLQVSMVLLDFISAVVLVNVATEELKRSEVISGHKIHVLREPRYLTSQKNRTDSPKS